MAMGHRSGVSGGEASSWLVGFGRFGFAAKGAVYTLIGILAIQTAIGAGGDTTGSTGALAHIAGAPFGRVILLAVGAGIVGYALWRFLQAFLDTDNKGTDAKGLVVRTGYFIIALIHVGLAISAFALVAGSGGGGEGDSTQAWTARLMAQPFGRWLVGIVGAIVLAYGGVNFVRSYKRKFLKKLKLDEMSEREETWTTRLGCLGYAARGVVFAIVGVFLIVAAIRVDPDKARGLDGALQTLAEQPWGWVVLAAVAIGLAAYGLFMFIEARYRRMVVR